jgi:quercetin dioxygenase-like cupin family protein
MQIWDLTTAGGEPSVLLSTPEARCIVLDLEPEGELAEHQVRERTILTVLDGSVTVTTGSSAEVCPAGTLVHLEPGETRRLQATARAKVLLVLAPWPAPGHFQPGEHEDPHDLPASATLPVRGAAS